VAFVAVVGSGPIGGALAQKLALRDRVREVRLIDAHPGIAQGKALDIAQSAAVEGFSARITASQSLHSAAGADVIAIADAGETGAEIAGESGLALLRQLLPADASAPLVFTGAAQRELLGRLVTELHVPRPRALGAAPFALESAVCALAGLAADGSGRDVQLQLVGTPPGAVAVGWEAATMAGAPLTAKIPPHAIAALAERIPRLWPPGPLSLASAAARIVEGIVNGSRRPFACFVSLEAGPARNAVVAMPVEVGPGGVRRILQPALTRQELTRMENAIDERTPAR
jgi:malate dehydrogenase